MKLKLGLLLLLCGQAFAQTYALAPSFPQQFLGNNGQPLAGGQIYTCAAGSTCPGVPQATYTDSTGLFPNTNPVILDASGRASIWLDVTKFYKFVLRDSTGVTIKTVDEVSAASGGSPAPTTNYWTLSGSAISNNNAGGAGDVNVGSSLNVGGPIVLTDAMKFRDGGGSPHYAVFRAANLMTADVTWRWPDSDAAGCLNSDGLGTLSFITCGGSGGGAVGPTGAIQYSNGTGGFQGSGNAVVDANGNLSLAGSGSVISIQGANGGVNVTGDSAFNSIQTIGGLLANLVSGSGTAAGLTIKANASQTAHLVNLTNSSSSIISFFDTDGSLNIPGLTMSAITGSAQCLHVNSSGVVSGTGSDCGGSGSSPVGPTGAIQFNDTGVFGGTGNALVDANGNISIGGSGSVIAIGGTTGGVNITADSLFNSFQTIGGFYANLAAGSGSAAGVTIKSNAAQSAHLLNIANSAGTNQAWFDNAFKLTTPGITISSITGLTQCLQIGSTGIISGTGSACGSGSGGVTSLNTLTGALAINNGGIANEITVTPSGSTISLTLPQQIGTASAVNFGTVTTTSFVASSATGASLAFQAGGGNFQVNGSGAISAAGAVTSFTGFYASNTALNAIHTSGSVNACEGGACSSSAAFQVNSTTVINSSGAFVGTGVSVSGGSVFGGAVLFNGGTLTPAGAGVTGSTCTQWTAGLCTHL